MQSQLRSGSGSVQIPWESGGTLHALPGGMDPATRPRREEPPRYRDGAGWALALLIALGLAVAFIWSSGAEHRAIEGMPPVQRQAVYEQAFGELQRLCGAGPRNDALEKRCLEQVAFVLQFPECDARCQGIARSHNPRPTK
jgi:hypothetical protein